MSKTIRSDRKNERSWNDLQSEKMEYVKRLQEEQESKRTLRDWKRIMEERDDEPAD